MQPNYDAMSDTEERQIMIALIKDGTFDLTNHPEVHGVLREEFNDDVLTRYSEKYDADDYSNLHEPEFRALLDALTDEMSTDVLLGIGDIYSIVKEELNNQILDAWVAQNPIKAYPLTFTEVQAHPKSLSMSDDDLCADCQFLAYCPGELSLCRLALQFDEGWPCTEENYVESCEYYTPVTSPDANWVDPTKSTPCEKGLLDKPF